MRTIPRRLLEHLQQPVTTTTRLLKIMGRGPSPLVYGLSMLDQNITYDDGDGELTYYATAGFDPSAFASDTGYSVDNAEGMALISEEVPHVSVEMIEAGELDDGRWACYLVNWADLSMGHMLLDAGDLGEVRTRYGMVWIPELLSYMARLKQPVGSVWSRSRCRAIFGTPAAAQDGCGVSLAPLWQSGIVLAVGAETNRVFTADTGTDSPTPSNYPARVQFLTGANAGREFATESIDGTVFTLAETTGYPIAEDDTFRWRPDCGKRYLEDCRDIYDNRVNFKGEPLIPVGDSTAVQAPGAEYGGDGWNAEIIR